MTWKPEADDIRVRYAHAEALGGEDFTVRGGTSWGSQRRKGGQGGFVEDLAFQYRIPLINLIDGAGGTVASAARISPSTWPARSTTPQRTSARASRRSAGFSRICRKTSGSSRLRPRRPSPAMIVTRHCFRSSPAIGVSRTTCASSSRSSSIATRRSKFSPPMASRSSRASRACRVEAAEDPARRQAEIEEELRRYASPLLTAEAFAVEDVIDPRDTRAYLCRFLEAARGKLATTLGPKYKSGVRP